MLSDFTRHTQLLYIINLYVFVHGRWFHHNGWIRVPVCCQLWQLMESSGPTQRSTAVNSFYFNCNILGFFLVIITLFYETGHIGSVFWNALVRLCPMLPSGLQWCSWAWSQLWRDRRHCAASGGRVSVPPTLGKPLHSLPSSGQRPLMLFSHIAYLFFSQDF